MLLIHRSKNGEPDTALLDRLLELQRGARTDQMIDEVAGAHALCVIPEGIHGAVLVTASAGIGPKLELAIALGNHRAAGRDLVATCVNEIVTTGAGPLFFVHHQASANIDSAVIEQVLSGIADGCRAASCALVGGQTLERPGAFAEGQYDLSGLAVGVVSRGALLGPEHVVPGDHLIAVASSGLHDEGHALARRVLVRDMGFGPSDAINELGCTVSEALTEPTRIYARAVARVSEAIGTGLHAICCVGAGGIGASLAPVLSEGFQARVDLESFERPALFRIIAERGNVDEDEMRRTFNLGVGLIAVVRPDRSLAAVEALEAAGESGWMFGDVRARNQGGVVFV